MFASAYILTVLACSPGGMVCRPTATQAEFASLDDCRAAITRVEDTVRRTFPSDTRFTIKGGCTESRQTEVSGVAWAVSPTGEMFTSFDRLPAGSGVAMASGWTGDIIDTTATASIEEDRKAEKTLETASADDDGFDTDRLLDRKPIIRGERPDGNFRQTVSLFNGGQPVLIETASR
ncbi:hypothetical protein E2A64_08890 [Pseudohoeflea suaedae]|uniref:Uncharacterized protein n=1 Tax=Pseudohoeflea suaedae TaxID=877384 RepID=A0A4R5PQJ9_9HYPH|nr:hypothetical protein [Pseudohoeflea suaedae]TDH39173.1 hypothetical protein E2A64_08890 [Pseudohoeflea suaedae]